MICNFDNCMELVSENNRLEFINNQSKPLPIGTRLYASLEYLTAEGFKKFENKYVCITDDNVLFGDAAQNIQADFEEYCKKTGKILKHVTVMKLN